MDRSSLKSWPSLVLAGVAICMVLLCMLFVLSNLKVEVVKEHVVAGNELHLAVINDRPMEELAAILRANPASLTIKDWYHGTPFDEALRRNKLEYVELFLQHGYNPNQTIDVTPGNIQLNTMTLLGYVTVMRDTSTAAQLLLEYGADPDFRTPDTRSATDLAEERGLSEFIRLFGGTSLKTP